MKLANAKSCDEEDLASGSMGFALAYFPYLNPNTRSTPSELRYDEVWKVLRLQIRICFNASLVLSR